MDFDEVGSSQLREVKPITVVSEGKLLKPMSIFHNKKHNLLAFLVLAPVSNIEWSISDLISELASITKAKEVIIADGIISGDKDVYYLSNFRGGQAKNAAKARDAAVIGVSAALLLNNDVRTTCFMGTTQNPRSEMADVNKSVACVIDVLNKYLNIDVSTKKFIEQSKKLQEDISDFMKNAQASRDESHRAYIG